MLRPVRRGVLVVGLWVRWGREAKEGDVRAPGQEEPRIRAVEKKKGSGKKKADQEDW